VSRHTHKHTHTHTHTHTRLSRLTAFGGVYICVCALLDRGGPPPRTHTHTHTHEREKTTRNNTQHVNTHTSKQDHKRKHLCRSSERACAHVCFFSWHTSHADRSTPSGIVVTHRVDGDTLPRYQRLFNHPTRELSMLKEDRCIYLSMSHHHTYYVTSSYMLCHIIIHAERGPLPAGEVALSELETMI